MELSIAPAPLLRGRTPSATKAREAGDCCNGPVSAGMDSVYEADTRAGQRCEIAGEIMETYAKRWLPCLTTPNAQVPLLTWTPQPKFFNQWQPEMPDMLPAAPLRPTHLPCAGPSK
ncbi:Ces1c [Symbiodinium sp. KB8]|nr:Ces1c [Symbiodinium sp. KB8]